MRAAFDRTIKLIGEEKFAVLRASHVLVVGLGGVGGAATEVLARSGVGELTLVDGDIFDRTNLNRQILCTESTVGEYKAIVAAARTKSIDPEIKVREVCEYISADNIGKILDGKYSYCVDAIDDIPNKLLLIAECKAKGVPIISALGAGNRTDCGFVYADIFDTKDDPFAKKLRHELRKMNIDALDVVCASSPPSIKRGTPASSAAPPFVMGAMLANRAVTAIIG